MEQNNDLGYLGDFWCLNPSSLTGGYGRLSDINSHYLTIIDPQGTNIRLNLSSCSRMETAVGSLNPQKGQQIFWSGVPANSFNTFNMYTCTFVWFWDKHVLILILFLITPCSFVFIINITTLPKRLIEKDKWFLGVNMGSSNCIIFAT